MDTKKTIHRSSTVDNAISILSLFLKYDSIGLMDMERELGISKTAAFRLAATMTDRGFLVKNPKSKQYYPGPILFQLVQKFQVNDITTISQPYIQELAERTNESIYLSIRTGNSYIFLTGIDSIYPVKVTIPFGDEIDLTIGAAGKLHMAYMSNADMETYIKRTGFEKNSPVDFENLEEDLARIRSLGYSTSFGEAFPDSGGVVAPIWGLGEEPTAALGLFLPMSRLSDDKKDELVKLVVDFADNISAEFKRRQETTQ